MNSFIRCVLAVSILANTSPAQASCVDSPTDVVREIIADVVLLERGYGNSLPEIGIRQAVDSAMRHTHDGNKIALAVVCAQLYGMHFLSLWSSSISMGGNRSSLWGKEAPHCSDS